VPNHNAVLEGTLLIYNDSNQGRLVAYDCSSGRVRRSVVIPGSPSFARGLVAFGDGLYGVDLKQIGDRKDWLSRPAIAQALARNPRTPPEVAVRALEHVGLEALRQMAKGTGAPPHVITAARKKVVGR
jgi:hypothetical protein